ncbi:MAG: hypothetical protein J0I87_05130, partial [Cellulomonas sp.]|nr:hypothetical protein [Cellulomonas sp.]
MSESLLAVEGLGVTFLAPRGTRLRPRAGGRSAAAGGVPAVRDVSFTVGADEVVALVGESGAGK